MLGSTFEGLAEGEAHGRVVVHSVDTVGKDGCEMGEVYCVRVAVKEQNVVRVYRSNSFLYTFVECD